MVSLVGKACWYLFGSLDEADEEELKKSIESGKNDTRIVASLLANQTELILSEFRRTHKKADELSNATDILNRQGKNQADGLDQLSGIQLLEMNLLQFEIDVQTITNAILFATSGMLHPKFFKTTMLNNSVKLASQTIITANFPSFEKSEPLATIAGILDMKILISDSRLIYSVNVSLIDYGNFTVYKASPLPITQRKMGMTNTFAFIWSDMQYFAPNDSKENYIKMEHDAIEKFRYLGWMRICRDVEPMQNIDTKAPCEVSIAAMT